MGQKAAVLIPEFISSTETQKEWQRCDFEYYVCWLSWGNTQLMIRTCLQTLLKVNLTPLTKPFNLRGDLARLRLLTVTDEYAESFNASGFHLMLGSIWKEATQGSCLLQILLGQQSHTPVHQVSVYKSVKTTDMRCDIVNKISKTQEYHTTTYWKCWWCQSSDQSVTIIQILLTVRTNWISSSPSPPSAIVSSLYHSLTQTLSLCSLH